MVSFISGSPEFLNDIMSEPQAAPAPQSAWKIWTCRIVWAIPLLIQAGVVLYLAWQVLIPYWNDRWIQDDAYISFRFAKHFVQGHGLVYNIGEPVEGYTNFLWTILSAIPLAFGKEDPLHFMHQLSLALWIGSYLILLGIGILLYREGNWAAPLASIPLLYHWSYNMWFFSGMETPLVSFLVILTLFFFTLDPEKHPTSLFWTSLSAIGLMLTRPDGVVLFPALALAGLILYWRQLFVERKWIRYVLMPALPILCVYVPYTLWRVNFYGSFYPNTYYAKVAYLTFYERGWEYLKTYLDIFRFAPWTPLLIAGAVLSGRNNNGRFLWGTLFATGFVFWYVVRLGGDFMEWRFVTPVTGILYPSLVIGAGMLGRRLIDTLVFLLSRPSPLRFLWPMRGMAWGLAGIIGWCAACATLVPFTQLTRNTEDDARNKLMPGQETIALLRRYCDPNIYDWRSVAEVFAEVIPKDARIATTSAGIIPFFCDRPCLDLHGLTDPVIAREPVDPSQRGRMGHEHWLQDYNEMRKRGVDIYLFWADPKPYAKALATPPQPNFEMVSARLPKKKFVEFLVLNHDKVKIEDLKKDSRLVFYNEKNISGPDDFYAVKSRYQNYEVIDRIDLENYLSQGAHSFEEIIPPDAPYGHNFHTKILSYGGSLSSVVLEDNGFRLWGQARFKVKSVKPGKPLAMVIRYDHTGSASYEVEVNEKKVPGKVSFFSGPEVWNEASIEIPAEFLVEGENSVLLSRIPSSPSDMEVYYIWFLQPKS